MARPREFDRDDVLQRVMALFWERGFAGTSLDAIDHASGLNRGSVYNAFGDKQRLYLETLDHYGQSEIAAGARAVREGGPAPVAIPALFDQAVAAIGEGGTHRRGCFMCNASTERAPVDPQVSSKVTAYLNVLRAAFVRSLTEHYLRDAGNDAANADDSESPVAAVADHLVATYMGLQVLAKAGCPVPQLQRVASAVPMLLERLERT